jgi:hypothetical protein
MSAGSPEVPRRRRGFTRWLWIIVIGALVLVTLWTLFMLSWSYSEGERAGVLQKFSKRGWVCKTYEGELAMYVVGGVAPQIWTFSVRDDAVAGELNKAVGHQVRLHYSEHPGLPTTCFGETRYFVEHVELAQSPGVIAPQSALTIGPQPGAPDASQPAATPAPTPPP